MQGQIPSAVAPIGNAIGNTLGNAMGGAQMMGTQAISGAAGVAAMPKKGLAGLPPAAIFGSGLALGILGTLMSIMLFSGEKPQPATNASVADSSETIMLDKDSQMALTDEMLMESMKAKGETP